MPGARPIPIPIRLPCIITEMTQTALVVQNTHGQDPQRWKATGYRLNHGSKYVPQKTPGEAFEGYKSITPSLGKSHEDNHFYLYCHE